MKPRLSFSSFPPLSLRQDLLKSFTYYLRITSKGVWIELEALRNCSYRDPLTGHLQLLTYLKHLLSKFFLTNLPLPQSLLAHLIFDFVLQKSCNFGIII